MPRCCLLAGDFYHTPDVMENIVRASGSGYDWDFRTSPDTVPWGGLSAYSLLVIACGGVLKPRESPDSWMDESTGKLISEFVMQGGGLIACHAGMASYPEQGAYRRLIGGSFQFHPREHPEFSIVPAGEEHPLLRGVSRFSLQDELYFISRDPDTTLLAVTDSPRYGSSAALWCAERGNGRVTAFTPGHLPAAAENDGVLRIMRNAIGWCRRRA